MTFEQLNDEAWLRDQLKQHKVLVRAHEGMGKQSAIEIV